MFSLPEGAWTILKRLNDRGHEAYVVGGCVRDSLLGLTPKDWDICTSATPDEMLKAFQGWHVVETGLKHGTVTVVLNHVPFEVTTFRVDGDYTDHRHPDAVTFVHDVRDDLARRDFTINAMAYHPETGLVDAFGSQEDLKAGIIRCVGNAEHRFTEDALRILRALRFSSTYDLAIDHDTAAAIHALHPTLKDVAAERIWTELSKLLCGKGVGRILREYTDVVTYLLPELTPCIGYEQKTRYHAWDVWEHIVRTVESAQPSIVLRSAMLLHDSGKPACFTIDENGNGHAYGHAQKSSEYAKAIFARMRVDNALRDRVLLLIEHHDIPLECDRKLMLRRLSRFGEEVLRQLIEVHRADAMGKGTQEEEQVNLWISSLYTMLDGILQEHPCVTLKGLAVNGADLVSAGFPKGPMMGRCLNHLLELVVAEQLPNEQRALLKEADTWRKQNGLQ